MYVVMTYKESIRCGFVKERRPDTRESETVLTFDAPCFIIYLKEFLNRCRDMSETSIFKVLSDRQRRDILVMLKEGRLSAGEIADRLGVTPAALSYHLKLLKNADLVMEYKSKNFIYYEINTTVFDELILWVQQFGGNRK